jgi:hypothetical protein
MKTKNSNRAPRDQTPGEIRYLNYYLEFPDGEVWSDYTHVVGGFHSWIERTALHKMNPDAAARLKSKGEYHWYVDHGAAGRVRHHMKLSDTPCPSNWGKRKTLEIVR